MKKLILTLVLVPLCLALFLFWLGFFSSRPPLTIDPALLHSLDMPDMTAL